jgi:hypothetical protein
VSTAKCILKISGNGEFVDVIAGSCIEGGSRNGPLLYSRFDSINVISAQSNDDEEEGNSEENLFLATLDSGLTNKKGRVSFINNWSVNDVGLFPNALDISLVCVGGKVKGVAFLLVLTPTYAFLIGGNMYGLFSPLHMKISKNSLNISSKQKILYENEDSYFVDKLIIFSDQMLLDLEIKNGSYDNNVNYDNNTDSNGNNAQPSLISCVLMLKEIFKGYVKLTAYILLNQSSICKMEIDIDITQNNNESYGILIKSIQSSCLKRTGDKAYNNIIKRDKLLSGGINNTIFTVDLENQIFQDVPLSKFDNQFCKCDIGLTMVPIIAKNSINYICIPSPPGGYTIISESARFIPCPVGTYNSNAMSVSPSACKKCPDGFIAPIEGSVLCTSCNSTHPWKSPLGTSCLSEFPSWISQKNGPCPNPGTQIQTFIGNNIRNITNIGDENSAMTTAMTSEICEYCPAMQSALYGEPCKPCDAGKISNIGSEYCSKICYSKSCSPYGLDTCYDSQEQSSYNLYTIAAVDTVTDKQRTDRLVDTASPKRKTISIAKFSNGSIITGDNMGTLTIIASSDGDFTVSIQIPQLTCLNVLEVSGDESLLFAADTLTGSIVQISMIMSSDVVIISKIQRPRHYIRPISLLFYCKEVSQSENNILLIVDELSNSILSLNLKSNIVSNIFNATAFAYYGGYNNSNNITNINSKIVYIVEWSDGIIFHVKIQIKNMDKGDSSDKRVTSFWYINSDNLLSKVVEYKKINILSYFENKRDANNSRGNLSGNYDYHISNWMIRRTIIATNNSKNDMIRYNVNYSIFGLDNTMTMIRDFDGVITQNFTVIDFFKLFTYRDINYNVNSEIINNDMMVIGKKEKAIFSGSIGDYVEDDVIVNAIPSSSIIDTPDFLILFIENSDSTYVKALFSRSCECASGFYMIYDKSSGGNVCVKCPTLTYSMVGSLGCSTCPSGQFLDKLGNCAICPERIWWDGEMYRPCRKMQSSLITAPDVFSNYNDAINNRGNLLISSYGKNGIFSLLEAQMMANVQKIGDIICMATFLSSAIHPSFDIFIQGDFLGKLWSIQTIIITPMPQLIEKKGGYNVYVKNETKAIDNEIVLDWAGLWILCDSPVQVYEPCVCKYNSFQLGYLANDGISSNNSDKNNGWEAARQKLSSVTVKSNNVSTNNAPNSNTSGSFSLFTTNSIYVIRPNDQYTTAPILISNGNDGVGFVKLYANNPPVGDMGLCFVGWPAKFNCTSPYFYWVFPSSVYPGGACVQCPDGTIAPTPSSLECLPVNAIKNPLCTIGTYKKQIISANSDEISYHCEVCPQNTYNSENYGVFRCKPKLVLSCPQGYYVKNMGSASDNICIQCIICPEDSIMIPYLDIPCTGETFYQPFVCVKWLQNIPGYYASLSTSDQMPYMKYFPCLHLPPYAIWSDGPALQDVCYFKCKYGVNQNMITEYALNFTLLSSNNRWPTKTTFLDDNSNIDNLFPYMLDMNLITSSICTPCNKSECPQNMWRPLWADGCGPPCYLSPELCYGRTDGCVASCNIPENSRIVGSVPSSGSSTACTWICLFGWFNGGGDNCVKCGAVNCKTDEYYVGDSDCLPHMKISEICKKCPLNVVGGVLSRQVGEIGNITSDNDSLVIIRRCIYDCLEHEGYYLNPNPYQRDATPCIRCPGSSLLSKNSNSNVAITCPVGYKVGCGNNPCQECTDLNILGGRAYLVQTNDDVCRVKCKPGYITTNAMYSNVLPFSNGSGGYDPRYIICEECLNRRDVECLQLPSCGIGMAPIMSQGDNNLKCAPCKTPSMIDCPPGTYYPFTRCDRSTEIYETCLSCPYYDFITKASIGDIVPGQWPTRFFISYNDAKRRGDTAIFLNTVISANLQPEIGCATACVSDSIISKLQGACVSCSILYPIIPKHAPYSRYHSLWNASEGLRWWPEEYDPPHIGKRPMDKLGNLLPEKRAGVCWPCPSNSPTHSPQSGENDPCSFKKKEVQVDTISFSLSNNDNSNVNGTISGSNTLPVQIKYTSAILQPATFVWIVNYDSDGSGVENNANRRRRLLSPSFSAITDANNVISSDKKQMMTVQDTSLFISCKPGQYLVLPEGRWCALCPKNFYCIGNKHQPIQCAMYSITVRQGSTSPVDCTCKRGYMSHFNNPPFIDINSYNSNDSLSLLSGKAKNSVSKKGDFVCKLIDEKSYTSCSPGYFRTPINYLKRALPSLVPRCMPCPQGTFGFNDQCHICPASSYANQVGSTSCDCISDITKAQNAKSHSDIIKGDIAITKKVCMSQEQCSVGDILDVTDSVCKPCQLNQATSIPNTNPPICMCEPGMMLITISRNSSSNLVKRRSSSNNNILLSSSTSSKRNYYFQYCKPCPKGTYSQYAGSSPCTPCPPLTTTSSYGSKNLFDCIKINSLFV